MLRFFYVRRKNVTGANSDNLDALWPELDEVTDNPIFREPRKLRAGCQPASVKVFSQKSHEGTFYMERSNYTETASRPRPKWLEWLRIFSSFLILMYAVRKLIGSGQFGLNDSLSNQPIGTLSGFQLTWYYYGFSHAYGTILGLTQAIGGILLLFRRSAVLGASVLTPVIFNILLINIFFSIAAGAEVLAAFILISCMLLLWHEKEKLVAVFWSEQRSETTLGDTAEKIAVAVVAVLLIVLAVIYVRHPAH